MIVGFLALLLPAFMQSYGTFPLTAGLCALAIPANERPSELRPTG